MSVHTRSGAERRPESAAPGVVNGFDPTTLRTFFEALEADPDGGRATFSTRTRWEEGDERVATRIRGYRIDGERLHDDEREHRVESDEYVEIGSTDSASSPGELLMSAVGSCITATTRAYAAMKGIRLTRLEIGVDGDVKLHGMFGLDAGTRAGFGQLRTTIRIAGDAGEDALREVALLGYQFSPVRETVHNGAPVTPEVEVTGQP